MDAADSYTLPSSMMHYETCTRGIAEVEQQAVGIEAIEHRLLVDRGEVDVLDGNRALEI